MRYGHLKDGSPEPEFASGFRLFEEVSYSGFRAFGWGYQGEEFLREAGVRHGESFSPAP